MLTWIRHQHDERRCPKRYANDMCVCVHCSVYMPPNATPSRTAPIPCGSNHDPGPSESAAASGRHCCTQRDDDDDIADPGTDDASIAMDIRVEDESDDASGRGLRLHKVNRLCWLEVTVDSGSEIIDLRPSHRQRTRRVFVVQSTPGVHAAELEEEAAAPRSPLHHSQLAPVAAA